VRAVKILAFDIGGAYTKGAALTIRRGEIEGIESDSIYFPFWLRALNELKQVLVSMCERLLGGSEPERILVTMTAELSDAFDSKRQGVGEILDQVEQALRSPCLVLDYDGHLVNSRKARSDYITVAGANWYATAWLAGVLHGDCIFMDSGSTTTDIIPVIQGKPCPQGRTDFERLGTGELVYTGALRTSIPSILRRVPLRGRNVRLSSERFSMSADAHLILSNIDETSYTCETADGRGRDWLASAKRLSRVVCADWGMLNREDILELARAVWMQQVKDIADALKEVMQRMNFDDSKLVVTTGLGGEYLAKEAAKSLGLQRIVKLAEGRLDSVASSAIALACMGAADMGVDVKRGLGY